MDKKFIERLKTEVVYLWEDEAEMLIKSNPLPGGKYLAKIPPDGPEFPIAADSDQVTRALVDPQEVTEKQYRNNTAPTTDKALAG